MRKISIKYRLLIIIIMFQLPLIVLQKTYSDNAKGNINLQLARGYSETLAVFCNAVNNQLSNVDAFLATECWSNPSFRYLSTVYSKEEASTLFKQFEDKTEILLDNNVDISGVSFYFEKSNFEHSQYSPAVAFTEEDYIRMNQITTKGRKTNSHTNTGWVFMEDDEKTYMVRTFAYEGAYCTIFIDLQQLTLKSQTHYKMSTPVIFIRDDHNITDAYWSRHVEEDLHRWDPESKYKKVTSRGKDYLVVSEPIMTMTALYGVRYNYDWDWLNVVLSLSIVVSVLSFILAWICMYLAFFKPLKGLLEVMNSIRNGNLKARAEDTKDKEFSIINKTFNNMLDTINKLKIRSYKNQIKAKNAQMNALRLQIRRHFFLNCLKNIYAMSHSGDNENIQEAVILLSGHLRYTLDISKNEVDLKTELDMCRNYIDLQGIGQERKPNLKIHIDEGLNKFPVPPISILSLVENCCKYGMAQDKALEIIIDISLRKLDGEGFVNVVITDNGSGFNENKLLKLNANPEALSSEGHVGIANVIERMKMIYGQECAMIFDNKEGASIEIIIPLKRDIYETINS